KRGGAECDGVRNFVVLENLFGGGRLAGAVFYQGAEREGAREEHEFGVEGRTGHERDVERLIRSRAETQTERGPAGPMSEEPGALRAQAFFVPKDALAENHPGIAQTFLRKDCFLVQIETDRGAKIGACSF